MKKRGFIKTIILIVIALLILGYFGYHIEDMIKNPAVQKNLHAFLNFILYLWNTFLIGPLTFIWGIIQNALAHIPRAGN